MHRVARVLGAAILVIAPVSLSVDRSGAQTSPVQCLLPSIAVGQVPTADFLTGGGFIIATATNASGTGLEPTPSRKNFGVGGGCKQGGDGHVLWGHLEYVDHGTGLNVHWTTITAYLTDVVFLPDPNARLICGTARTNDPMHPNVFFGVRAADHGLPDNTDKFDIQLADQTTFLTFYTTFVVGFPHTLAGGSITLHKPNPSTMGAITESCPALGID